MDRQARLWVGTWGDGVSVFDGKNWISYNSSNSGLIDNFITSLLIDKQGIVWIGTINKGIIRFDGVEWKQINTSNSSLPRNNITSISINEKGAKWLGFDGLGVGNFEQLGLFEGKSIEIVSTKNSKLPNDYVKSIVLDFNSYPWVATWGGLAYLKGGKEWKVFTTQNSKMPHNWVTSVAIDAYGNKWAGTMGRGIVNIQDNNLFGDTIWSVYNNSNSKLPNNNVICLAFDKKNNLWVGLQNGLVKFENAELNDETKVSIYNVNNSGLLDNLIKAIAFDDNNIWIGTTQGLSKVNINQINDKNKWTHYNTYNSGLPNNTVTSIFIDYRNNKWITTEGGLAIFNENGVKIKPDPPSYPPMVSAVAEFIEPSQNFMLDALETGYIEIQFFNDGQGKAQDVFAQIQPENQPGLIYRSVYFIGEIPGNSQIKARIPIIATTKVPTGQYTFNIMFYEAYKFDPKPTFVTFKTKGFAPPDLVLLEQVVEDLNKNGIVEKMEEVKIKLKIQNKGKGDAKDVKVKLNIGNNIFIAEKEEKEFNLGDFEPQQTKEITIILFSNNRATEFPVSLDITEKFNKYNKTNIKVPIKFSAASK
jgi:streptogramin lyase